MKALKKVAKAAKHIMIVVRWLDKWRSIHLSLNFLLLFLSKRKSKEETFLYKISKA
jgi:hypothetical protein